MNNNLQDDQIANIKEERVSPAPVDDQLTNEEEETNIVEVKVEFPEWDHSYNKCEADSYGRGDGMKRCTDSSEEYGMKRRRHSGCMPQQEEGTHQSYVPSPPPPAPYQNKAAFKSKTAQHSDSNGLGLALANFGQTIKSALESRQHSSEDDAFCNFIGKRVAAVLASKQSPKEKARFRLKISALCDEEELSQLD